MSCPQCQGIEQLFDLRMARKELKQYRQKGPAGTTRYLLDWLTQSGKSGLTLLDVGGGVGAIQHELLPAGVVKTAVHLDAASAYLQVSQEEAERLGHADQITYQFGNFVDLADGLDPADLVMLDRVICCYHDMPALVKSAAESSNHLIGLVFPQDRWIFKWGVRLVDFLLGFSKNPFRLFIHSTQAVDALLQQHGFERRAHKKFLVWQSMMYVKQPAPT